MLDCARRMYGHECQQAVGQQLVQEIAGFLHCLIIGYQLRQIDKESSVEPTPLASRNMGSRPLETRPAKHAFWSRPATKVEAKERPLSRISSPEADWSDSTLHRHTRRQFTLAGERSDGFEVIMSAGIIGRHRFWRRYEGCQRKGQHIQLWQCGSKNSQNLHRCLTPTPVKYSRSQTQNGDADGNVPNFAEARR